MPTGPQFGEWLAASDGTAHYYIRGKALCGCTLPGTEAVKRKRTSRSEKEPDGALITPFCERCDEANERRWAGKQAARVAPGLLRPRTDQIPPPSPEKRASAEAEAAWLFACADPARLAILRAMASGPKTMKELAAASGLPSSNVSTHVARLKRVGVVSTLRAGSFQTCSLRDATVRAGYLVLAHTSGLKVTIPLD